MMHVKLLVVIIYEMEQLNVLEAVLITYWSMKCFFIPSICFTVDFGEESGPIPLP